MRALLQTHEIDGFDVRANAGQVAESAQEKEHFFLVERVTNAVKEFQELFQQRPKLLKCVVFRLAYQIALSMFDKCIKNAYSLILFERLHTLHHVENFEDLLGEVVHLKQTQNDDRDV